MCRILLLVVFVYMWFIKMKYKFYIKEILKRYVNKVILILIIWKEFNIKDKLLERFILY